jgi:hypothetical protein
VNKRKKYEGLDRDNKEEYAVVPLESGTASKLEESIKYRVKKSSHHNVGIQLRTNYWAVALHE